MKTTPLKVHMPSKKLASQPRHTLKQLPQDQELVMRIIPMPADCNINGDIFGGWVMAQVDLAGAVMAWRVVKGRMATVAVNEFVFKEPVMAGDLLSFFSKVERLGNTSVTVSVEVYSEQLHNQGEYRKVTQASLTYVAIDAKGRPRSIQKTTSPKAVRQTKAPFKRTKSQAPGTLASSASSSTKSLTKSLATKSKKLTTPKVKSNA
jgi:acyl-CoA thioesterase YciA